jgi:uncharacterized membrane protein YcaP (DUF421 family)
MSRFIDGILSGMPLLLSDLFRFTVSPWELVIRGTAMFLLLFGIFRFVLRRDVGGVGLADILVLVVVSDAAQNAMAGEYKTISEGAVLVGTIVAWNYFFDHMAFHYRWFAKLVEPPPLALIHHGKVIRSNLRKEMISVDELKSQVRLKGLETFAEVKCAFMEPDGAFSVIPYEKEKGV